MSPASVVTLHPFEDEEALQWLTDRLDGQIEMRVAELARQFGWPRYKLRRRLAAWAKAGRFSQQTSGKDKIVLVPVGGRGEQSPPRQAAARLVGRAFGAEFALTTPIQKPRRNFVTKAAAALLLMIALVLCAVGIVMNARFAASFGQTIEAAVLFAAIGLAIDLLAVTLPAVASDLWKQRSIVAAGVAWSIWLAALLMSLLAATGFASTNIGDAVAGRDRVISESAALTRLVTQLRAERAAVSETRAPAAVEAALQQAQTSAEGVWRVTSGCRDVTRPSSVRACAPILQLREALANAQRRDALDDQLRQLGDKLAALPATAAADPQARTAAEIVTWLSAGWLSPNPQDMAWLRTIGLALAPSFAGVIGALSLSLLQTRRPEKSNKFNNLGRAFNHL